MTLTLVKGDQRPAKKLPVSITTVSVSLVLNVRKIQAAHGDSPLDTRYYR